MYGQMNFEVWPEQRSHGSLLPSALSLSIRSHNIFYSFKKKVVKFHTLGPDPLPPKSCETSFFFPWPENHFYLIIIKVFKVYWSGGTPTPFTEKFYCRFGWIRTWKKKMWKCQNFGMTPPQLWKFTTFFCFLEWIPPLWYIYR